MSLSNDANDDFKEFLEDLKIIQSGQLGALIHPIDEKCLSEKIACKFYMLTCNATEPREREFVKLLLSRLIHYVLDKKECLPVGTTSEDVLARARDLYVKARRKFLEKNPKSGEPGELVLFLLLESQNIIQIVSKMKLKTSKEMHVHGLDGIHIQVDGNIILHYGEAKMYEELGEAIESALCSIKDYTTDLDKQDIEVDIISDFIDDSKFEGFTALIRNLVNPYGEDHTRLATKNSVLLAYDWREMASLKPEGEKTLEEIMSLEYRKLLDALAKDVGRRVNSFENPAVRKQDFDFYLIPFKSVVKFRQKFFKELKHA